MSDKEHSAYHTYDDFRQFLFDIVRKVSPAPSSAINTLLDVIVMVIAMNKTPGTTDAKLDDLCDRLGIEFTAKLKAGIRAVEKVNADFDKINKATEN